MRSVTQNVRTGELELLELPAPSVAPGCVLIQTQHSLVSAGTEKTSRQLAKKSLLKKAWERPDHVRRVLRKMRTEGLATTVRQVRERLDEPMQMGYCSAGVVVQCGAGVTEFRPGDRVASNGHHAEMVNVAKNLCAGIPDNVSSEHAAFTVLGAIAMQGVRLSKTSLGETAFVVGLGLVGQITVALLKAAGVRVIGTDPDPAKCELARSMGAAEARVGVTAAEVGHLTRGAGADAVLITASTHSNGPIELAAHAVRRKGRVVLVGVVGLSLDRRPFYFKEAEFVVSCSYGPGRYDPDYEQRGHDYPLAHVRWTEQRNMQAVLDLMSAGQLNLEPLVSHRFSIDRAAEAYDLIDSGDQPYLGIVLDYPRRASAARRRIQLGADSTVQDGAIGIGCLGAGNFARTVLLPALCSLSGIRREVLCSSAGLSATHTGRRLGFASASSDPSDVFDSQAVDAALILTRHDQHSRQVVQGIRSKKHVFVEKPLCLTEAQLAEIEDALAKSSEEGRILMVGFNRRFSPASRAVKTAFANCVTPLTVSIRFNAGAIAPDHWVHDEAIGGGRIIGEACHAIDLATFLTGSPVTRVFAESIFGPRSPEISEDQCFISLRHANGSVSNVAYLAGGDKAFPKERVEVFGGGQTAVIDNFRRAELWASGRHKRLWKGAQDKGHRNELVAFLDAIKRGQAAPIPWREIRATTMASILAVRSLRDGIPLDVSEAGVTTDMPASVGRDRAA